MLDSLILEELILEKYLTLGTWQHIYNQVMISIN